MNERVYSLCSLYTNFDISVEIQHMTTTKMLPTHCHCYYTGGTGAYTGLAGKGGVIEARAGVGGAYSYTFRFVR